MKALYNGKLIDIIPQIKFEGNNDGIAIICDKNEESREVAVYGWNAEEPYATEPLYFIEIPTLNKEQRFDLIAQFEEWYGDTVQDTSSWALEFELIVRMFCSEMPALIVNPQFLEIDEQMYEVLKSIIWNSSKEAVKGDFVYVKERENSGKCGSGIVIDALTKEETKSCKMWGQLVKIRFNDGEIEELTYGYELLDKIRECNTAYKDCKDCKYAYHMPDGTILTNDEACAGCNEDPEHKNFTPVE